MVKHLSELEFEAFVGEKKLALIDFWATWCGPCRAVAPVMEQLDADYAGRIHIGKVDVDESGALAARFGVMSIPTVVLLENGKEVERRVGAMPAAAYKSMIDAHL